MDKILKLTIDEALDGRKIEYVLEKHMKLSSTLVKKLKRTDNGILLNGKSAAVIEKVRCGDNIEITVKEESSDNIVPVNIPLEILYEDEDILAVNKPRSMPVHPSRKYQTDTLANAVMYYLGKSCAFHVITRLDRDTSGVVLIAKNKVAAAFLSEEIKNKRISREYVAVVNGVLPEKCGTISAPIKRKGENGIARCVSPDGKETVSEYEVVKTNGELSLVKLRPITGRTHQLRVHMSYMGNPIYGDTMYGAPKGERTLLHCQCISFFHASANREITVTSPVPEDIGLF